MVYNGDRSANSPHFRPATFNLKGFPPTVRQLKRPFKLLKAKSLTNFCNYAR